MLCEYEATGFFAEGSRMDEPTELEGCSRPDCLPIVWMCECITRVRGTQVKWLGISIDYVISVAPRAGAWIETDGACYAAMHCSEVAPRAGAWIETGSAVTRTQRWSSRAPCGRVD